MAWSAAQYTKFEDERTRPVRDLVAAIPTVNAAAVVDLGCGPGNSTEVLAARYPDARIVALDSSIDMCAAARRRMPRAQIDHATVEEWRDPGPWDVILANAVFHWVGDHERQLPRLVGSVAPGGSLAIQMPDNLDEPSHVLMREVASGPRWSERLAGAAGARTEIASPEWYFDLLRPLCTRVDIWRTTYFHHLTAGLDGIVEWFKGSGLRPFLEPLEPAEQAEYLTAYREELANAYPVMADGSVLLPFPRLFVMATR